MAKSSASVAPYLSLAKTGAGRLLHIIANASERPSPDTADTSRADAVTNTIASTDAGHARTVRFVQTRGRRQRRVDGRRCPSRGASFVPMMQSAHFRERDHAPFR